MLPFCQQPLNQFTRPEAEREKFLACLSGRRCSVDIVVSIPVVYVQCTVSTGLGGLRTHWKRPKPLNGMDSCTSPVSSSAGEWAMGWSMDISRSLHAGGTTITQAKGQKGDNRWAGI